MSRRQHEFRAEEEQLLKQWAERASVYRVLHHIAYNRYRSKSRLYTIPVIILSTIAGTANWAQSEMKDISWAPFVIGTINIMCGIISTIAQFLRISELMESHRVASLGWGKYYRGLSAELARSPDDRPPVFEMMRQSRVEFERLSEMSPIVDEEILKIFEREYKDEMPEEMSRPEICDGFRAVHVFEPESVQRQAQVVALAAQRFHQNRQVHPNVDVEMQTPPSVHSSVHSDDIYEDATDPTKVFMTT